MKTHNANYAIILKGCAFAINFQDIGAFRRFLNNLAFKCLHKPHELNNVPLEIYKATTAPQLGGNTYLYIIEDGILKNDVVIQLNGQFD